MAARHRACKTALATSSCPAIGDATASREGSPDVPCRCAPFHGVVLLHEVAALQRLLENDSTRTEAVEIIRSLVVQVIFRPTAEAALEVELVGEIATMVHLAQNSNGNSPVSGAVHDEFTRSVKLVAGARNDLYRTRFYPIRRAVYSRPL
jgi:hypothetical protein